MYNASGFDGHRNRLRCTLKPLALNYGFSTKNGCIRK